MKVKECKNRLKIVRKMVKVLVLSDLHLEYHESAASLWATLLRKLPYFLREPDADEVMCLCGDIGYPLKASEAGFAEMKEDDEYEEEEVLQGEPEPKLVELLRMFTARWPGRTLLVAGNHEYYCGQPGRPRLVLNMLRHICEETGVTLLDRSTVELDGVTFLGCTLWSKITAQDYGRMHDRIAVFTGHEQYLAAHAEDRMWLRDTLRVLRSKQRVVVLTHHAPSFQVLHPRFQGGCQTGFASNLEALLDPACVALWACGHSHESVDMSINGVRVVLSPLGYPDEDDRVTEPLDLVVQID